MKVDNLDSQKCIHLENELSVKDVSDIFDKNYRTILLWLNQNKADKNRNKIVYSHGKFPHAYKCIVCGRIFIPSKDVENVLEAMKII